MIWWKEINMEYTNVLKNIRKLGLIMILLLVSSMLFTGGCLDLLEPKYQTGELRFSIAPMTESIRVFEGEMFKIYLVLINFGNETVNVWDLEEQISYDIHVYDSNNNEVHYECGIISRPMLTDKALVELRPAQSIIDTRSSGCWNLAEGIYTINAVYRTSTGEDIKSPYWLGEIRSNNLTITVVKPPVLKPDPLMFSIRNYSNDSHEIRVEVFDENNTSIFDETYLINASEGEYSLTKIRSPIVTETLGTYKYVITLDNDFTAVQFVDVRYAESLSSSDHLSIDVHDNKENPLSLGISIA
jgi:hypothetical protein